MTHEYAGLRRAYRCPTFDLHMTNISNKYLSFGNPSQLIPISNARPNVTLRGVLPMPSMTTETSVEQFELSSYTPSRSQTQTTDGSGGHDGVPGEDVLIQELKPVDGGVAAWTVLITAFVFEAVLWGRYKAPTPTRLKCELLGHRLSHLVRCLPGILLHFTAIRRKF